MKVIFMSEKPRLSLYGHNVNQGVLSSILYYQVCAMYISCNNFFSNYAGQFLKWLFYKTC